MLRILCRIMLMAIIPAVLFSCHNQVEKSAQNSTGEGNSGTTEKTLHYDWPAWNGPLKDRRSHETGWDPLLIESEDAIKWKIRIGMGYSGIAVSGSSLYTMGLEPVEKNIRKGMNIIYRLNFETGEEIWRFSYPGSRSQYPGPRAIPLIYEEKLYTIGQDGDLYCHDALSGDTLWFVNVVEKYGAVIPEFGFVSTPVIDGNILFLNALTWGIALDKDTGETVWISDKGESGYAPVEPFTYNEKRYVAVFGYAKLYIVEAQTGIVLTSYKWETFHGCNIAAPLIMGNRLFVSSSYDYGNALLELKDDMLVPVWENTQMKHHMMPGILYEDGLYIGNDGFENKDIGNTKAININTGEVYWEYDTGVATTVAVADKIFVLTTMGKLSVIPAVKTEYRELASMKFKRNQWFTPPTFCRGRLFLRNNKGDIICLDLSGKEPEL